MKKRILKTVSAFLILSLFAGGLTSCKREEKKAANENVTLKWVMSGPGMQKDSKLVWDEANKLLSELLPNTTLDIEVIPISDYADKWKLIEASEKPVDIAWCGWMIDFTAEVRRGAYTEIGELLKEHAPKLRKSMPEWVWENVSDDGGIYAIPCYQRMVSTPAGLMTFKEYSDEYFHAEKFEEIMQDVRNAPCGSEPISEEAFEMIDSYLGALKRDGKLKKGFRPDIEAWIPERNIYQGTQVETAYISFDENGKPTAHDAYSLELTDTFYKYMSEFYKKGYIREDVLTTSSFDDRIGREGYVLWCSNYDAMTERMVSLSAGEEIKVLPLGNVVSKTNSAFGTNLVIPKTAENPERAIKFLEILNDPEDTRLYNLLVYGIEGKHYEKTDKNKIRTFDYSGAPDTDSAYGIQKWMIGNTFNAYLTQADLPEYNEYLLNDLNVNFSAPNLEGFRFDPEPVKIELAKIENVQKKFKGLRYGFYEDYKEKVREYRSEIQNCGQQAVIKEIQRQLDLWYESCQK